MDIVLIKAKIKKNLAGYTNSKVESVDKIMIIPMAYKVC